VSESKTSQQLWAVVIIAIASITVATILCFGMVMSSIIAKLSIRPAVTQHDVEVYADKNWQDTGVEIKQGETITIQYVSGEWSPFSGYYTEGQGCTDPNVCTQDLSVLESFPDNIVSGIHATLIARINQGPIIVVGNEVTFEAENTGSLMLRMNDKNTSDNSGSLIVSVKIRR
jgi:hypothetical protein